MRESPPLTQLLPSPPLADTALKSTNETMQAIVRNEEKFEEYVEEKIKNYNKRVGPPDPGDTRKWINQIYLFKFVVGNKASLQRLCRQEKAKEYVNQLNELNQLKSSSKSIAALIPIVL